MFDVELKTISKQCYLKCLILSLKLKYIADLIQKFKWHLKNKCVKSEGSIETTSDF